ncbi:hypothetical protein STENM223S_06162 [Streptomyces tendae]
MIPRIRGATQSDDLPAPGRRIRSTPPARLSRTTPAPGTAQRSRPTSVSKVASGGQAKRNGV